LLRESVGTLSGDDDKVRLLHHLSIGYHEAKNWERLLCGLRLPLEVADYAAFIDSQTLHSAAKDLAIEGDTFLAQFRCLHQIPELLSFEANEYLAEATVALRDGSAEHALINVIAANDLVAGMVDAMATLTDSLFLADYHEIRQNLGVTSGSHSVSIRYHLGRDLYLQFCEALLAAIQQRSSKSRGDGDAPSVSMRVEDPLWFVLIRESLRLRLLLAQWRQWHLHLPRANLGTNMTRSLAGSPDAVHTATLMRDEAARDDGLTPLARQFGLDAPTGPGPVASHLQARGLDAWILGLRGEVTKERFPDVQNRAGYFAVTGRFSVPPKRRV
jgi:hypothetical protein